MSTNRFGTDFPTRTTQAANLNFRIEELCVGTICNISNDLPPKSASACQMHGFSADETFCHPDSRATHPAMILEIIRSQDNSTITHVKYIHISHLTALTHGDGGWQLYQDTILNGRIPPDSGPVSLLKVTRGPLSDRQFSKMQRAVNYKFIEDSGLTGTNWLILGHWYIIEIEHPVKLTSSRRWPLNYHRLDRDSYGTLMEEMSRHHPYDLFWRPKEAWEYLYIADSKLLNQQEDYFCDIISELVSEGDLFVFVGYPTMTAAPRSQGLSKEGPEKEKPIALLARCRTADPVFSALVRKKIRKTYCYNRIPGRNKGTCTTQYTLQNVRYWKEFRAHPDQPDCCWPKRKNFTI
ncbi:hypothetical protein GLAREA_05258 [Glarea lozoyensis ATCC 20868]|uniref:Uncharacterized protein n=1 Tax=Glarea lozoyensis (strain ATCC 20868 / MF5171) TaxID=1116229 RepID=S3DDU6_GLAL2|nr:uncharacterized protein GLAREA_05258 [Glarea lozoyensis ATCC 20868]EPE35920.1 hypothetical protein GLAREA_05258 [Glarea lozoyensis ATCC 20868]